MCLNLQLLLSLFLRVVVLILNNFHFDLSSVPTQMEKAKFSGTYDTSSSSWLDRTKQASAAILSWGIRLFYDFSEASSLRTLLVYWDINVILHKLPVLDKMFDHRVLRQFQDAILHVWYMCSKMYKSFSHDVTASILLFQKNEMTGMLVNQTNPIGVEFFSYVSFISRNLHVYWPRDSKRSM